MPQAPARVLTFGETVVQVWPHGLVTILPGGSQVYATPHATDEYRETARRLGYGEDALRMCKEHDLLHALLCHALGLAESPTLRRVASGEGDSTLTGLEEQMVLATAAFCNAAGIDLLTELGR